MPHPSWSESRCTGKERDTETGLDYFGARYYGSNMGRWLSPDWAASAEPVPYADLSDPQTLNLYGYVRNNPLAKADPDGHCAGVLECVVGVGTAVSEGISWAASGAAAGVTALGALAYEEITQPLNISGGGSRFGVGAEGGATEKMIQQSQTAESTTQQARGVPNPNGSKGAPDHQQTADDEAAKIGPNGQREVRVETPGGQKGSRVIDAAKVENGKVTEAVQVIRPNKNGTPPAREARAAADIQKASGVQPKLVPVKPIKKPDGQ